MIKRRKMRIAGKKVESVNGHQMLFRILIALKLIKIKFPKYLIYKNKFCKKKVKYFPVDFY